MLTNGELARPDVPGDLRQFRVLAMHGDYIWVEALNGNYKGEYLTFPRKSLRPLVEPQ